MTTFNEIRDLQEREIILRKTLWIIIVIYIILIPFIFDFILYLTPIYGFIVYIIIEKMKKIKNKISEDKEKIEINPDLLDEYYKDKQECDFMERIIFLRSEITRKYKKASSLEKNGHRDLASKCREEIATLESELQNLGWKEWIIL